MNVSITSRHYKAPQDIKEYVEQKVEKMSKFHNGIVGCEVILERGHDDESVEIRLKTPGKTLRVKETSNDMTKSVDLAVDRLERQLKKHKQKTRDHDRQTVSDAIDLRSEGLRTEFKKNLALEN